MTQTAKRKLSEISFEHDGAHVALVSKQQGGGANNKNFALVLKANKFSKEALEKMQSIKVTLDIPTFLEKFFHLYGTQAEVLARMLGYVPPEVEQEEYDEDWYENYIQSKLQSFEIIKSAYEADNVATVLSELDETQYLALLKDQQSLERAFKKLDKEQKAESKLSKSSSTESKTTVVTVVADTSPDVEAKETKVSPSVVTKNKETNMTVESTVVDKEVEVVEKSAFVAIEKQMQEQKVALEKAMATITAFETEKKQAIAKAKTDKVNALIKDEKQAQAIAKAGLSLESEDDFTAFLGAIQAMVTAVDTSEMFVEKGASVEVTSEVSPLERILKAKFQSK